MLLQATVLTGRQVLWMIYDHYATDPGMTTLYGITELTLLSQRYPKDDDLEKAWTSWDNLLANMRPDDVSKTQLLQIALTYLGQSKVMEPTIHLFRQLPSGSQDFTYDELVLRWQKVLRIRQEDRNRAALQMGLHLGGPAAAAQEICRQQLPDPDQPDQLSDASSDQLSDASSDQPDQLSDASSDQPGYNDVCLFYNKGKCRRGENCPYLHVFVTPEEFNRLEQRYAAQRNRSRDRRPSRSPSPSPHADG